MPISPSPSTSGRSSTPMAPRAISTRPAASWPIREALMTDMMQKSPSSLLTVVRPKSSASRAPVKPEALLAPGCCRRRRMRPRRHPHRDFHGRGGLGVARRRLGGRRPLAAAGVQDEDIAGRITAACASSRCALPCWKRLRSAPRLQFLMLVPLSTPLPRRT